MGLVSLFWQVAQLALLVVTPTILYLLFRFDSFTGTQLCPGTKLCPMRHNCTFRPIGHNFVPWDTILSQSTKCSFRTKLLVLWGCCYLTIQHENLFQLRNLDFLHCQPQNNIIWCRSNISSLGTKLCPRGHNCVPWDTIVHFVPWDTISSPGTQLCPGKWIKP